MNVAILHYHLNRGGVTRVIVNQLLALDQAAGEGEWFRVLILHGGRAEGWPEELAGQLSRVELSLRALPELDYNEGPVAQPDALAAKLRQLLDETGFSPDDTLLHAHNHSLGKNASYPGALRVLAGQGYPLLLQVHDFAEDFRPRNYRLLAEALGEENVQAVQYPQATHIHYAALSRRDETILASANVSPSRLHWLPNPVPALGPLPDRDAAKARLAELCGIAKEETYWLYPVRGIRRKNQGELLLWAALGDESQQMGVTLAPLNPHERVYYDRWASLAAELKLRCHMGTGDAGKLEFLENLAAADRILTTSVAEGFGMVYLEAWLANRPLMGRDLPDITADFREAGLRFEDLYDRVSVPVDWIGENTFRRELWAAYAVVLESYHLPPLEPAEFEQAMATKIVDGTVDFGDLNETLQEKVIRQVAANKTDRETLLSLNPQIERALRREQTDETIIAQNRELIETDYSAAASGRRLRSLYNDVLSSPRGDITDSPGRSILNRFLDLRRFRLIRT